MSRVGSVIDGKYEILREIGRGGMSVVYLALDRRLNKQWAVKEVQRTASSQSNEVVYQSLLTEANLMKKLDHPRLPRIVDIIEQGDTLFVVMDYIEGLPMNKVLKNNGADKQKDIKAWEKQVVQWGIQLCGVLQYLHTREPAIIYRDMKPSNIMLKPDGSVNVFDFGIAREFKEGKTGDTASLGTRGYAAPEQFGNNGQTDARTDIYNLGITLYEMLTGKDPTEPPYTLYPIRHWNPQLSDGMEWIIQKCTQPDPAARFQSCEELMYYLRNVEGMDRSVVARQKRKLMSFVVPAMLTVVFLIVGIVGTVGKITSDRRNYDEAIDREDYKEAAKIYPKRLKAYEACLEDIENEKEIVERGDNSDKNILAALGINDENNAFGALVQDMKTKADSEEAKSYIKLCYGLGEAFWQYYDPNMENVDKNGVEVEQQQIDKAYSYFRICNEPEYKEVRSEALSSEEIDKLDIYTAIHNYKAGDIQNNPDEFLDKWEELAKQNEGEKITADDSKIPKELREQYFYCVYDFVNSRIRDLKSQLQAREGNSEAKYSQEDEIRDLYKAVVDACVKLNPDKNKDSRLKDIVDSQETCEQYLNKVFGDNNDDSNADNEKEEG